MSSNNILLSIRGVQKRFGDLQALSDMNLEIHKGEIYSLIGPGGADKTTFFNVITGLYTPDAGELILGGTPYQPIAVYEVVKAGAAHTFRNIRLFGDITVAGNVMMGRRMRTRTGLAGAAFRTRVAHKEERSIEDWAHDLLGYVGVGKYANYTARNLSYGHQCCLEIARVLATQPKLLALDEPTVGMNATEKAGLHGLFNKIRSDGKTVLLIEHDVKLVMDLCNHLTMLDYDKVIARDLPHEVQSNPTVIEVYLGASVH